MAQEFGRLTLTRHYELGEDAVTAKFEGPGLVMISKELVQNADVQYLQVHADNLISICQFELRIVGELPEQGVYIAQRISTHEPA